MGFAADVVERIVERHHAQIAILGDFRGRSNSLFGNARRPFMGGFSPNCTPALIGMCPVFS